MTIQEAPSPARTVTAIATGLILVGILGGFAVLFGYAIILTLQATDNVPAQINDAFVTVSNALMGAVIAILASTKLVEKQDLTSQTTRADFNLLKAIAQGIRIHKPNLTLQDWRAIIGLIYFVVYFVLGIGAIGAWLTKSSVIVEGQVVNLVPALVQTFATVFLGSVIPVGIRFFTDE